MLVECHHKMLSAVCGWFALDFTFGISSHFCFSFSAQNLLVPIILLVFAVQTFNAYHWTGFKDFGPSIIG